MIVSMYMTREVATAPPSLPVKEAAALMREKKIRRLVVMEDERIAGILCARDFARAGSVSPGVISPPVSSIMQRRVVTIDQDKPLENAAQLMTRYHIGGLPVSQRGRLVGIITESDVFRALADLLAGKPPSARVTFDLSDGEDALEFLVRQTAQLDMKLTSFALFEEGGRQMAVARVHGKNAKAFVDSVWDCGRAVVSALIDA